MLLKSLELQGFKTFPDKTKLNFDKGITAVVGPNGSGKSNISDAIRWVLGEQSVKALRCGKMEDVIFDGTDERKSKGYAKVSLTIDNKDRIIELDEDEVCITRRYYRSGESEYLINSKTVRLRDINELFMDTGLGRDGYSIIGQGKIDQIVASKSSERRDIFEEAAGISKFRYRKIEAQRQLAKTDENLVRVNDIFSELEQRVAPLKEQSEKADKFLKYSEKKKELEVGIWLSDIKRYEKLLKEQEDKLFVVKQRENENNKEAEKIQDKIEKISEEITFCSLKISKSRDELSQNEASLSENKNYISVYKNDIFHNEKNIDTIKQQKEQTFKDRQISKQKISELEEQREKLIDNEAEIEETLRKNEASFNAIKEQLTSNQDRQANISQKIELLNESFSDKNINIVRLSSTLEGLEKKIEDCELALKENKNRLVDTDKTCAKYNEITNTIKAKQDEISEKIKRIQNEGECIQREISKKQSECNEFILSCKESEKKAQMLEDLEKNFEGYSRSVKFVMNMAKSGRLFGICAPVSMLIDADKRYKVALETALGAASQNIVCNDENSAKKAIYMLKEKNVGRATFLPLSVIKKREFNSYELRNKDGFIDMADKLCKTEDKYLNIISNLLSRVGVVRDIDCAVRIAKATGYRIKLVTLDGQVINPGGSMTGGSANRTSGLLSRLRDVEELRNNAKEALYKSEQIKKDLQSLQDKLSRGNDEIKELWASFNVFNQDKVRIKTEEETITRERTKIQSEIIELEKIKDKTLTDLKRAEENKGSAIDEKQRSISEIERQKKKLSDLKDEYDRVILSKDDYQDKINASRIQRLSVEKDIEILSDKLREVSLSLEKSDGSIALYNNEILDLSAKNNDLKEKIDRLNCEAENLEKAIKNLRSDIELFSEQRDNAEKNSFKLRDKEKEVLKEHEEIAQDLVRFEEKMSGLKLSYDSIIAKLWDEYELTKNEANQENYNIEDIVSAKKELISLKNKIKGLGNVNLSAIEEYKEVSERYLFMKKQINDIEKSKKELLRQIDRLTSDMQIRFKEKFYQINENFKNIFRELFSGGKASLELTDESDILNCGIEIKVKPPGKVVSHLELLSGGEKAMVSIVLYFAIMKVNPPPFCVLDEIEAALDDMNIERYVAYLKKINDKTQFIAITHRRGTMEEADVLYGVTMQEKGVSKLLQLEAAQMAQKLNII